MLLPRSDIFLAATPIADNHIAQTLIGNGVFSEQRFHTNTCPAWLALAPYLC